MALWFNSTCWVYGYYDDLINKRYNVGVMSSSRHDNFAAVCPIYIPRNRWVNIDTAEFIDVDVTCGNRDVLARNQG